MQRVQCFDEEIESGKLAGFFFKELQIVLNQHFQIWSLKIVHLGPAMLVKLGKLTFWLK